MTMSDSWTQAQAAMSPLEFARRCLGFWPDAIQAGILERAPEFRKIALNCCRQWGKSTLAAVLAVHRLVTEAKITILIVGPVGRQAGETLGKVRDFLRILGIPLRTDGINENSLLLPNGSRVVALPAVADTIRGYSAVSMLILEEASRISDEVYISLLPCLAVSRGDLVVLSTQYGRRGFFYRAIMGNEAGWLRHTGPVTECARIPEEFVESYKAQGEECFRQELLCEFIDNGTQLMSEDDVLATMRNREESWDDV